MKTTVNILIFAFFSCVYMFGQEKHGGIPLMFGNMLNGFRGAKEVFIEKKEFPIIDNEKELRQADSVAQTNGYAKNKFYGIGVPVNLDFKQSATVENVGDSGKVYLLKLISPTAYALQVYFDAFKIPKGSRMFIYDSEKTMFLGSFTHENNFVNNRFGTEFVKGNSLIIEYYEPNIVEFESQLHIERLVHTFLKLKHGPFSWNNPESSTGKGASSCEINVSCPLGYGWDREQRSVAIILGEFHQANSPTIYNGFCSGAIINNTAQDGRPFFLTANHCIDPNRSLKTNALDWIFLFNHATSTCNDNGSNVSSYLGQSIYGAFELRADGECSPTTDYLLLELNTSAFTLANYGVVYAGWEADESKATNSSYTVGIHHPNGDVKKISLDANQPVSSDAPNFNDERCPYYVAQNSYWKIVWDMGITEQGSSGSPLFNSNHKIIGQLYGGGSYCSTPNAPDYYGKFSKSYTNGALSYWLDPYLSGATSIGSYNPSDINEHCYNGIKDDNEAGIDCGGNCPPCGWTPPGSADGWISDPCNNGVKDNDETGIDCGGACRPCGGTTQCSNCKKDGDETGIDCGGSCPPCNNGCSVESVTYTNSNLPVFVSANNTIEAKTNVVIHSSQNVIFKAANKIILRPGFHAENGSTFSARIAPCDCKQPCAIRAPNVFTPNGDGINDDLRYVVSGYNRYEVQIYNRYNTLIYQSSGYIYDNYPILWNGNNSASGQAYRVIATFYSDCSSTSKTVDQIVNVFKSINPNADEMGKNLKDMNVNDIVSENTLKDISIYPNPANESITIDYPYQDKPLIYIVDEIGKVMYVKDHVDIRNNNSFNISNFYKGLYIVKIIGEKGLFAKKILKN